jgi:hypothetical protein
VIPTPPPVLSPQTIDALAEIITGGPGGLSGGSPSGAGGIYRSGPGIERFMRSSGVDFQLTGSRVPSVVQFLLEQNRLPGGIELIKRLIEAATDPRDYIGNTEQLAGVIAYINARLKFDGLKVEGRATASQVVTLEGGFPAAESLSSVAEHISFDTVQRDLDRALDSAEKDPEDAVTAASSTLESVCRSILIELGEPLPDKKDIQGLFNAVKRPLGIAADRSDLNPAFASDIRTILGGLNTVVQGIGALRTHAGDAHGREKGFVRIDTRIANLAIHSAATVALFLIETWQRKYPAKGLRRH